MSLLLLALVGCSKPNPPVKPADDIKDNKTTKIELPGKLKGQKWHIPWFMRDSKNPNGPLLPVLIADAEEGEIMNTENATLLLRKVHAQIFRNGVVSAIVKAPKVTANQGEWVFIGSHGVTVQSLTDPPNTVITGDKVTWDMKSKLLVAEGHANITHHSDDGKVSSVDGNRITFDTALKTSKIE